MKNQHRKTAFYSSLGNSNYLKKRTSRNRFQVSPIPIVPQLMLVYFPHIYDKTFPSRSLMFIFIEILFSGGGDRFKPNMVDQFNDRPKTSLPMTKLPKQKFAWNQNITEDNLKILEELDRNDRNSESKSLFKGMQTYRMLLFISASDVERCSDAHRI